MSERTEVLIQRYLQEKRPGWAQETQKNERRALENFLRFLIRESRELDRQAVVAFGAELGRRRTVKGQPWSPHSLRSVLAPLCRFLRWCWLHGYRLQDLAAFIALPSARSLPQPLSESELVQLLEAGPRPGPLQARDRTILELLYGTGLRVSELMRLQVEDVDLSEKILRVRLGKGRKDRLVPFGNRLRQALVDYLRYGRAFQPGTLFLSHRATPLGRSALEGIVAEAGRRAGLSRAVSPHRLRHSYATHLLRHGAPLPALQRLLGHASLASTQTYLGVEVTDLARMIQRSHPRERQAPARARPGGDSDPGAAPPKTTAQAAPAPSTRQDGL